MVKQAKKTTAPKVKNPSKQNQSKKKKAAGVVLQNSDGTVSHIPGKEVVKLRKELKNEQVEQIVSLSKPNTVYLTSDDLIAGADLNWQEVIEYILAAKIATTNNPPPIGPAAIKAYLWWFMIDRLRAVGGLYPEPTTLVVPTFPDNGNIPSGWAKFVEHLMPYVDPDTKTTYQFRYKYIYGIPAGSAVPATTSAVLNPSAPGGDFSFSAIQNFFLVPSPTPALGSLNELTWTFVNNAFNFQTDVVANNGDISQWIASTGAYTEAKCVPYTAPDASAVAIPYAYAVTSNFNPGVYCNTKHFDPEMACILHPPQQVVTLNIAAYSNIVPFDWRTEPLPQSFNAAPVKTFPAGSNLAIVGQPELLANYGYITHNTKYVIGSRKTYLTMGQKLWPNLVSYRPFYYPLNNQGYHQAIASIIEMLAVNSSSAIIPAPGDIAPGILTDNGDLMVLYAFFESKYLARTTEFAYVGLLFNTTDDVCSQTQFASEFRDVANNPVLEDMLDVWAPTVRHGRLCVFYQDYRPITAYGFNYNANLAGVNVNASRWIKIGDDFGSAAGNVNDFSPQIAGAYVGYANGPWSFTAQQVGNASWAIRGPGQTVGAPNFSIIISSANLGTTSPLPPTYALGTVVGPLAPCLYGPRLAIKAMEIMGAGGLGTWTSFNYAKLGGYCNQTQVSAVLLPDNTVISTTQGGAVYTNLNFRYAPQKLGAYFPLDKESVGRSFAYTPRISFNAVADKFPTLQAIGGNSSVQDALISNTQLGPGSAYNRMVQAKMTDGLDPIASARSALGSYHVDIIPNFAGEEMVTWMAIEMILKFKNFVSVAPYHVEHTASLTSYNSPNIFEQFVNSILDIGERIVGGVGNIIGSVASLGGGELIGEIAGGVASKFLFGALGRGDVTDFKRPFSVPAIKALPKPLSKHVTRVVTPNLDKIKSVNDKAHKKSVVAFSKITVKHEPVPVTLPSHSDIDIDFITQQVLDRFKTPDRKSVV